MSEFPECECFADHRRAVCRNEAAGKPLNGANSVNAYRKAWGFAPLDGPDRSVGVEPPKRMSLMQRAATAVRVIGTTAINAATGKRAFVSGEVRAERFAICQACEHFSRGNCQLCSCSCNKSSQLTNKLAHASSECPVKKWGPVAVAKRGPRSTKFPPLIGVPIDRNKLVSHILYHVMPVRGDTEWVWRQHFEWLREVRSQYNGRLIVGIVTPGPKDHWDYFPPAAVQAMLVGMDAEFITAPNDVVRKTERQGRGEGVLFPLMLEKLKTDDPNQVAFYGHCKGVSRKGVSRDKPPWLWAEAMFETLFRNHDAAVDALDTKGVAGPFRMRGGLPLGRAGIGPNWFYSGTFFAMRLVDVFRRNWSKLPNHYGNVEQWPRLNFALDTESACLFFDGVTNLYDEQYWPREITPALIKWRAERASGTV